jgi:hypothetical protein
MLWRVRVPPSRSEAFRCSSRVPGPLPVLPLSLRLSVDATAAFSLASSVNTVAAASYRFPCRMPSIPESLALITYRPSHLRLVLPPVLSSA